jgi:fructose-1,6-bisphosphatase/inositol monophosphatase family enzyme
LGALRYEQALQKVPYGKADTLELDATPENAIKHVLTEWFDPNLILITEEDSKKANLSGSDHEVVCFVDPLDGSKLLTEFLQNNIC